MAAPPPKIMMHTSPGQFFRSVSAQSVGRAEVHSPMQAAAQQRAGSRQAVTCPGSPRKTMTRCASATSQDAGSPVAMRRVITAASPHAVFSPASPASPHRRAVMAASTPSGDGAASTSEVRQYSPVVVRSQVPQVAAELHSSKSAASGDIGALVEAVVDRKLSAALEERLSLGELGAKAQQDAMVAMTQRNAELKAAVDVLQGRVDGWQPRLRAELDALLEPLRAEVDKLRSLVGDKDLAQQPMPRMLSGNSTASAAVSAMNAEEAEAEDRGAQPMPAPQATVAIGRRQCSDNSVAAAMLRRGAEAAAMSRQETPLSRPLSRQCTEGSAAAVARNASDRASPHASIVEQIAFVKAEQLELAQDHGEMQAALLQLSQNFSDDLRELSSQLASERSQWSEAQRALGQQMTDSLRTMEESSAQLAKQIAELRQSPLPGSGAPPPRKPETRTATEDSSVAGSTCSTSESGGEALHQQVVGGAIVKLVCAPSSAAASRQASEATPAHRKLPAGQLAASQGCTTVAVRTVAGPPPPVGLASPAPSATRIVSTPTSPTRLVCATQSLYGAMTGSTHSV